MVNEILKKYRIIHYIRYSNANVIVHTERSIRNINLHLGFRINLIFEAHSAKFHFGTFSIKIYIFLIILS